MGTMKTATINLDDDVKSVLKRSTIDGSNLFLPPGLDRPLYVKVNKAIEALGGKWVRKTSAHVFPQSGEEIKKLWGDAIFWDG